MKQRILLYALLLLACIGIIDSVIKNPSKMLIPVFVFGAVFLLLKYPPNNWKGLFILQKKKTAHRARSKKAKFRVIQGNKKTSDNDNIPKYH